MWPRIALNSLSFCFCLPSSESISDSAQLHLPVLFTFLIVLSDMNVLVFQSQVFRGTASELCVTDCFYPWAIYLSCAGGQWCTFPGWPCCLRSMMLRQDRGLCISCLPLPVWNSLPMNELGLEPWASQPARPSVELPSCLSVGQEREERSWLIYHSTENQPLPCGAGGRLRSAENLLP